MNYLPEKDWQQLAVLRAMVRDLAFGVEVVGMPIVREPDGLAMSSRNAYLHPDERRAATVLHRALSAAAKEIAAGERDAMRLITLMRKTLEGERLASIDYVEIVDAEAPACACGCRC